MTPEEIFVWQVWIVLREIQEQEYVTVKGKPVKFRLYPTEEILTISVVRKRDILYKLEEKGAFTIQRNAKRVRIGTGEIFYLIINHDRFNEICEEFRQKNNKDNQEIKQQNDSPQENLNIRYKNIIEEVNPANTTINLDVRYKSTLDKIAKSSFNKSELEKKYDVLRAMWIVYESQSRANSVLVPVAAVTVKNRAPEEVDRVVQELRNEGVFTDWERKDRYYAIQHINHDIFPKKYEETKNRTILDPVVSITTTKKPKFEVKGGIGCIKYGKNESKPFKKLKGRQWKLVKQLVEFFGVAKTDESTYDNIQIPSDELCSDLQDSYLRGKKIHSIIETTIAEIQRNFAHSSLTGQFSIHHEKHQVWMDLLQ